MTYGTGLAGGCSHNEFVFKLFINSSKLGLNMLELHELCSPKPSLLPKAQLTER
jgi:hypothetical protein